MNSIDKLLIEPVWNRNCRQPLITITGKRTFNRTSMESKLRKRRSRKARNTLLIEPVWNRNFGSSTSYVLIR